MAKKTIYEDAYLRLVAELRERRISLGFSQMQLATHLGWPQQKISSVETGSRRLDVLEFCLITSALDLSYEEMSDLIKVARRTVRAQPIAADQAR